MERIQELRKQRGLSQAALGEKLGVKQNTISQWESGARHLDDKTLSLLADVFGVSVDSLLGRAQNEWLQPLLEAYLRAPDWVRHRVCRTLGIEYLRPAAAPGWVTRPIYRDPAAAGVPLDASPDWETVDFPAGDVPKEALFGVRIQGEGAWGFAMQFMQMWRMIGRAFPNEERPGPLRVRKATGRRPAGIPGSGREPAG